MYPVVKRALDFVCSLLGVVLLSPLLVVLALLVKCTSPGPVLFRQKRVGRNKTYFEILKFRSMRADTPRDVPTHLLQNAENAITPVGRFLRKTSLDELPQLFNIDQIMEIDNSYVLIYEMRPGLTSEATLYNGYTDSMEKMLKRLQMDIHYLENRSLALDFSIIMRTAASIISGKKF